MVHFKRVKCVQFDYTHRFKCHKNNKYVDCIYLSNRFGLYRITTKLAESFMYQFMVPDA